MTDSPESGAIYPGALSNSVEQIRGVLAEIDEKQKIRAKIVEEKEAAIEKAIKPFQGRIDYYDGELERLGDTNLTLFVEDALREYRETLSTVDAAALAIFINENGDGIQEFCYDIKKSVVEDLTYETRAERTLGIFSIFQNFSRTLAESSDGLAVGILNIDWWEDVDVIEGLTASEDEHTPTGIFSKIVKGYFGHIMPDSLEIKSELKNDGAVEYAMPRAIQANLVAARIFTPIKNWGSVTGAYVDPVSEAIPYAIVGTNNDFHQPIDWERSQERDFSCLRSTMTESVYRSLEPTQVLLYGDGLRVGLDELIADEKVNEAIKPTLQQERDRLG